MAWLTIIQVPDHIPGLTIRQGMMLLTIYPDPLPHTVCGLATGPGDTRPVISHALDTTGAVKLIDRKRDLQDCHNAIIQYTVEGALYLQQITGIIFGATREIKQ